MAQRRLPRATTLRHHGPGDYQGGWDSAQSASSVELAGPQLRLELLDARQAIDIALGKYFRQSRLPAAPRMRSRFRARA